MSKEVQEQADRAKQREALKNQVGDLGKVVNKTQQTQSQLSNNFILFQRVLNDVVKDNVRTDPSNGSVDYNWYISQIEGSTWFCHLLNKIYRNIEDDAERLSVMMLGPGAFVERLKKSLTGQAIEIDQNRQPVGVFDRAEKVKEFDATINVVIGDRTTSICLKQGLDPEISSDTQITQPELTIKVEIDDWKYLLCGMDGWKTPFTLGRIIFDGTPETNPETGQVGNLLTPLGKIMSIVMTPDLQNKERQEN